MPKGDTGENKKIKELVVVSGKGGTGKTTLTGIGAQIIDSAVFCDCDVDAANLGLILNPEIEKTYEFYTIPRAKIDSQLCTECGKCVQLCRFDAITDFRVDVSECEGCGLCARICPVNAISMHKILGGHWYVSRTQKGPLVHARLEPGEENSGLLVTQVRKEAREVAKSKGKDLVLTDGPPGIGCPAIASISGADTALVVTEPTLSGIHDLERMLSVCRQFGVNAAVCINKWDIDEDNTEKIKKVCERHDCELAGLIPYDEGIPKALVKGEDLMTSIEDESLRAPAFIKDMWRNLLGLVSQN